MTDLSSGNALYDAELHRRTDARRFPVVVLELASATRLGDGNCYRVEGNVTIHGVTQRLVGTVTTTVHEGHRGPRRHGDDVAT